MVHLNPDLGCARRDRSSEVGEENEVYTPPLIDSSLSDANDVA